MDSAQKTLVDIAFVSRRVFDTLVKHAGHKTAETFQLEKIVVASGAILKTLNKTLVLGSGTSIDDRLLDWLNSEEPKLCLDILNRMEALLCSKLDPGYGVKRLFQSSRSVSTKDQEALRHFWRHEGYFHFLLSTDIWNRENGTQQRALGVPPATHKAVVNRDLPQVTKHKSRDRSSVAQGKKTRKQGVDTKKLNSIVRQLGAWSCKVTHGRTLRLRQPDTCTWLPNQSAYETWSNTEDAFLWLHGKAGAGKSVLAASVIDGLKSSLQDDEVLAYFYCDFRDEQSTSAAAVMRSLLSQLLQQFSSHTADPGDLIDELAKEKDEMVSASARNFACYLSRTAKHFSRQPFLVLDALDECKDVEELLDALMELNKGGIRLFVTSRPLQVIKDSFLGLPSIDMDTMKYEVSVDIKLHVTRELDSHRRLRMMDASLKDEIYSVLCEKADGMFRWAQCQLSVLKLCMTAVQVREALNDLPSDLNETYERILLKTNEDERGGKVARRALDWLVVALQPLRLSQIMKGLSIDPVRRVLDSNSGPVHGSALLDVLGSLVTYNDTTDIVILSHYSVKEYLTAKSTRTRHSAYHVDEHAAHRQVALLCMCYIGIYLERSGRSGNQELSRQSTRNTRIRLDNSSVAAHSIKRHRSPLPTSEFDSLDEYVFSHGFSHLTYINSGNRGVLRAIETLHSNAQQHPSEWDQLCRRPDIFGWPALKDDFVLYILIHFASKPLFHSYLGSTQWKLKDGTNPLIYAAYSCELEYARTLLSRGVKLNRRGWDVRRRGQCLPLEAAVDWGDYDMVTLFLAEGSPVPHKLFVMALRSKDICGRFPARTVAKLLQTDEFTEWAADVQDHELLLRALDLERYSRPSEQDVDTIERRLIQLGCDPSSRFNETYLRHAVSAGHVSTVEYMLSLSIPLPPDIILDASCSMTSDAEMIHLCIRKGCDIHAVSSTEDTALHFALALTRSVGGDVCSENVQTLIDAGCNPSAPNLAGKTPLHLAVREGYTSIAEYLLPLYEQLPPDILLAASESYEQLSMIELLTNKGVDVHTLTASGNTPLHLVLDSWADSEQCLACVKILISAGCDPCLPNAYGETPLHVAARNGHFSVIQYLHGRLHSPFPHDILLTVVGRNSPGGVFPSIKFLISKGAGIHVICPDGDTLLHLTMKVRPESECLKITEIFIAAGCDPRACNLAGETLFHIAAREGYISVMEYLLSLDKCDLRACNLAGETPFHIAAKKGHVSVMEYLLSLGVSVPSDVMVTLLEEFNGLGYEHLTIPFLLDKGGDIHAIAQNGDTLLHLAAGLHSEEKAFGLAQLLVHAGCMPCVPNSLQETPLHVAARRGFTSVVKFLLPLSVTLPPDILLAASAGYFVEAQVIHHLVKEGASVSVSTTDGDTPLHLVLSGVKEDGRLECAKILVDAGCDPYARNLAGNTPLHNAAMHGFGTVLEYLLSRGASGPLPDDILLSSTATTVQVLLGKGLDLRSVPTDDLTELIHRALDHPWRNNAMELARILICHGTGWDPSLKNSAGETAFHAAARTGNIEALKFFLSRNVPLPFDVLVAALGVDSCGYDRVPLTRLLIREGASVDVVASNGDTPLHLALMSDDLDPPGPPSWEVVEILLSCGADPSARNSDGQTPLDLAKKEGHFFEQNFLRLVRNSHAHRQQYS